MSIGCVLSYGFTAFGTRRPWGGEEVEAFLAWFANARGVAVSTHKQALSALLFFYRKVLGVDLP
jgi:hypothetical protein